MVQKLLDKPQQIIHNDHNNNMTIWLVVLVLLIKWKIMVYLGIIMVNNGYSNGIPVIYGWWF